jgi:DNA-binding transcriptional LysR family regulator
MPRRPGAVASAVSEAVRELEADLGVRLFERRARGLIVTQGGHQMLRHARGILEQVAAARRELGQAARARRRRGACSWASRR